MTYNAQHRQLLWWRVAAIPVLVGTLGYAAYCGSNRKEPAQPPPTIEESTFLSIETAVGKYFGDRDEIVELQDWEEVYVLLERKDTPYVTPPSQLPKGQLDYFAGQILLERIAEIKDEEQKHPLKK